MNQLMSLISGNTSSTPVHAMTSGGSESGQAFAQVLQQLGKLSSGEARPLSELALAASARPGIPSALLQALAGHSGAEQWMEQLDKLEALLQSEDAGGPDLAPLDEAEQQELLVMVDEMIRMLVQTQTQASASSMMEADGTPELEQTLSKLATLLTEAALAGAGSPGLHDRSVAVGEDSMTSAAAEPRQGATLKQELLQAVQQLRAELVQGLEPAAEQKYGPLLERQLAALTALVSGKRADSALPTGLAVDMESELDLKGGTLQVVTRSASGAQDHLLKLSHSLLFRPEWTVQAVGERKTQTGGEALPEDSAFPAPAAAAAVLPDTGNKAPQTSRLVFSQPVPIQQFAETMTGMLIKQFRTSGGQGTTEARLTLHPEQLGEVNIRITLHHGQLTAQIMADNSMAKDMLESQLSQLRSALQQQGLQVDRLEVSQPQAHAQSELGGRQPGSQREQQSEHRHNESASGGESRFDSELNEISEQLGLDGLGYGRTVNVTA
ncbi:flagellar hook-length control protein FliK [Paenibacillus sabuli]|nr:flagellar hook-length control protein FliK [Paenibacillus sabuli]